MKTFITTLALLITTLFFAQEDSCQEFLDKMSLAVEKNEIENAKLFMKGFIVCKEENLGKDNKIVKSFDQMEYLNKLDNGNFLSKLKSGGFLILDKHFNLKKQIIVKEIGKFINNVAVVKNDYYNHGVIDSNGNFIFECKYKPINHYFINNTNYYLINNNILYKETDEIYNSGKTIKIVNNKNFLAYVKENLTTQNDIFLKILDFEGKDIFNFQKVEKIYHNKYQDLFYLYYGDDRIAVANTNGNIIIPKEKYKNVDFYYDKNIRFMTNYIQLDKNIFTISGKEILNNIYNVGEIQNRYIKIRKDNYSYLFDFKGNLIFKDKLKDIHFFDKNSYSIVEDNAGCFYLDTDLKPITNKRYKKCYQFNDENRAFIENYGNYKGENYYKSEIYGVINTKGEEIIPPVYRSIKRINDYFIVVATDFEILDLTGNNFSGKLYSNILNNNQYNNNIWVDLNKYSTNFNVVKYNGKYGMIDSTGVETISTIYDKLYYPSEGLCLAKLNGLYGYIDTKNNQKTLFKFQNATIFNEGLAAVQIEGKYVYIDKDENLIIDKKFNYAGAFRNNLAVVGTDQFYFNLINKKGEILDNVYGLSEFDANIVSNYSRYGMIKFSDFAGYYVSIPPQYDKIEKTNGINIIKLNGKYGACDDNHNLIIPIKYDKIEVWNGDNFEVKLNNKKFKINMKGECFQNCENAPENHPKVK